MTATDFGTMVASLVRQHDACASKARDGEETQPFSYEIRCSATPRPHIACNAPRARVALAALVAMPSVVVDGVRVLAYVAPVAGCSPG